MRERDPAAVITQLGARSADRLSEMTLAVFISVYGAEAGYLALKALAVGGVVVAGGIAPRVMPALTPRPLVTAFRDKGRPSALMEAIPLLVPPDPKTAPPRAPPLAPTLCTGGPRQ